MRIDVAYTCVPSMVRLRPRSGVWTWLEMAWFRRLEMAGVGLDLIMEIDRGKELQQLRTIRFVIVPPGGYCYYNTNARRHPQQEWAVCRL